MMLITVISPENLVADLSRKTNADNSYNRVHSNGSSLKSLLAYRVSSKQSCPSGPPSPRQVNGVSVVRR